MRRALWALLFATAAATSAAVTSAAAQAPDAPSPSASAAPPAISGEFELKFDTATYDVTPEQPFEVKLASGEKVTATLVKRKSRTFKGDGLAFEFSPEFKLQREADGDLVTISLDHPRSPMAMIQIFPGEVKPDDVPKELLDGIKKEFKDKAATLVKEPFAVQRDFKSGKLTGQGLQYKIGGQQIDVEVYSWAQGARTVGLTLQWSADEADVAKQMLDPLVTSIDGAP